ncbi:MAG: AzlD domain-containing protein [Lachnospiraceae bacterium]|nr:AzlD domain-containing protein [Lachnospiraceae bacterium]
MEFSTFMIYLVVMAGVTYLIRVVPFVLFKKEITNERFKMFLSYVPYAVLAAMTIPSIFSATRSVISAAIGTVVAVAAGYMKKGLLTVAVISCIAVFIAEYVMTYIGIL